MYESIVRYDVVNWEDSLIESRESINVFGF